MKHFSDLSRKRTGIRWRYWNRFTVINRLVFLEAGTRFGIGYTRSHYMFAEQFPVNRIPTRSVSGDPLRRSLVFNTALYIIPVQTHACMCLFSGCNIYPLPTSILNTFTDWILICISRMRPWRTGKILCSDVFRFPLGIGYFYLVYSVYIGFFIFILWRGSYYKSY